eukprot:GEZU01023660.1.p1 GENE.GEZU01023660.1~~GEZU01023660.1.p1  ORF type:complete len:300 (-),score=67.41 GEZU01023660.1:23-922(-)
MEAKNSDIKLHESTKGWEAKSGADLYERVRPTYPNEAVDYIVDSLPLAGAQDLRILDIGAGTGKFTACLFSSICSRLASLPAASTCKVTITAVEPVQEMRAKLIQLSEQLANKDQSNSIRVTIEVVSGTAQQLPDSIKDSSVDAITCAQAFHWFAIKDALQEFNRVLKPNGKLCLIWNTRDLSIDVLLKLDQIIESYNTDNAPRYASGAWRNVFAENPDLFQLARSHTFEHLIVQRGNLKQILDRFSSTSFILSMNDADRDVVLQKLANVLKTHPDTRDKQEYELPLNTDVYIYEAKKQ